MGFFTSIRNTYGNDLVKELKMWTNLVSKIAAVRNRRIFLLKCRSLNVKPTHITSGIKNVNQLLSQSRGRVRSEVQRFNEGVTRKIINLEIKITHTQIDYYEKQLDDIKSKVKNALPLHIFLEFQHRMVVRYNKSFYTIKHKNIKKIDSLMEKTAHLLKTPDSWLVNYTSVGIPEGVKTMLSLGPKFSVRPNITDVNLPRLLSDLDYAVQCVDKRSQNVLTAKVVNVVTNFLNNRKKNNDVYNDLLVDTRKFFKENDEILITRSDKGNATVLIDRSRYKELALTLLSDSDYYTIIPRDPTSTIQQNSNKLISQFKKYGKIPADVASKLMTYDAAVPKFYGLPKVHKPVLSLRPIISSIQAPTSRISRFLTDVLSDAYNKNNEFYVRDSFDFSNFINEFYLPEGFVLISLDVVSLFTNVHVSLAKDSIECNWELISDVCDIDKSTFLSMLQFVFDNTYFVYDGKFYKQKLGTPMGATMSPIISQYVMDDLLKTCIPKLPFQLPFLKKFVDDIICAVPHDQIDQTLRIFNNYNKYIQFTVEREIDNSVPFLDMKVIRDDHLIKTDWYIKPSSSGRFLHYQSYHPNNMKLNLLTSFRQRVLKLSHSSFHQKNLKKLAELFISNGYPVRLVNNIIFNSTTTVNTEAQSRDLSTLETRSITYCSIPYVRGFTDEIIRLFREYDNVKFAKKTVKTNHNVVFSKLKDKTNPQRLSSVVYGVQCIDCDGQYIGQTSRWLSARMSSHRSDAKLNKNTCALAIHVNEMDHRMDYDSARVLFVEKNYRKRLFLEMVSIYTHSETINRKLDTRNLSDIYCNILEHIIKHNNS